MSVKQRFRRKKVLIKCGRQLRRNRKKCVPILKQLHNQKERRTSFISTTKP